MKMEKVFLFILLMNKYEQQNSSVHFSGPTVDNKRYNNKYHMKKS